MAEDKFVDALRRSLCDTYPEASIRIDWDPHVSLTQVQARVADPSFNPDDVMDRVWYLKDLWRLVWEAATDSLDQAGRKACPCQ
ncbi:MAG: hypothetical protein Q8N51_04105 [Gammaproteobacteria bacterium]|nr:hypothetical protein [Gammaproteobacteria bacterium]